MKFSPVSRRQALAVTAATLFPVEAQTADYDPGLIQRHDAAVDSILKLQITDPSHPRRGGYADEFGIYSPGAGTGTLDLFMSAHLCPQSKHFRSTLLVERMKLAVGFLATVTTPEGNVNNPVTNFNSPPDTAFAILGAAHAVRLAQMHGQPELQAIPEPWLTRAAAAVARGGIHTPNHRWVVCEALSLVNEIMPSPVFEKRIDQWLAEGIDIDNDGQYNERSTSVYNPITDHALLVTALKRKRPELLDAVRRNLNSMLYLLHPNGEVVTDISVRQDQFTRGDMARYWFPLRYMAMRDKNGQYAALARRYEPVSASLGDYMRFPELRGPLPVDAALPEDYEKFMPEAGVFRVRRGKLSASLLLNGNHRFFSIRHGEAVIQSVRFASAFFGKGQFSKYRWRRDGSAVHLEQTLDGPYFQPFEPSRKVRWDEYDSSRASRPQSEVCHMKYEVIAREQKGGMTLEINATGTADVPLAVEISLRPGGTLEGCVPAPKLPDGFLLKRGDAVYRVGKDAIRFGPGIGEHTYTQVRGAESKLPGTSVYLCGFTPFRKTISFTGASA